MDFTKNFLAVSTPENETIAQMHLPMAMGIPWESDVTWITLSCSGDASAAKLSDFHPDSNGTHETDIRKRSRVPNI